VQNARKAQKINSSLQSKGHVGPPTPGAILKLADVPEMGYYAREGKGELLVRGPIVFRGYFKEPERTAQVLKDGWLYTGDIGTFTEVNQRFF